MQIKGVVGTAAGSAYFGIKPYLVLVERPLCAHDGKIINILVHTDFKAISETEYEVMPSRYQFDALAVPLTPQLELLYTQLGGNIEDLKWRFARAAEAKQKEIERLKRSRRMSGDTTSCPGFKKAFDLEVIECKECKGFFPGEFEACRRACVKQAEDDDGGTKTNKEAQTMTAANQTTQPAPAPAAATPPTPAPVAPVAPKEKKTGKYEGFREGSNADALQKFLKGKGKATVEECAAHLVVVSKKPIDLKKATETVKAYLWEWKKGEWAGVVRPFPFTVTVDGPNVAYAEKA